MATCQPEAVVGHESDNQNQRTTNKAIVVKPELFVDPDKDIVKQLIEEEIEN